VFANIIFHVPTQRHNFEKDMERTETPWPNQVELRRRHGLPIQSTHLTGTGMTKISA
jgi:hypothetical protein